MCIGARYAMISAKIEVMRFIKAYKFTTNMKESEIKMKLAFTGKMSTKHLVTIHKRNWFKNLLIKIYRLRTLNYTRSSAQCQIPFHNIWWHLFHGLVLVGVVIVKLWMWIAVISYEAGDVGIFLRWSEWWWCVNWWIFGIIDKWISRITRTSNIELTQNSFWI